MAQILLGLGSNIEPRKQLNQALLDLGHAFDNVEVSPWFESHALRGGANYLNLVVRAQTDLSLDQVRTTLNRIEDENGRERGNEASGCALDIDLLCFDQLKIATADYQLPRTDLVEHAHVLWPAAELCPDMLHPGLGVSFAQLWSERRELLLKNQNLWPI